MSIATDPPDERRALAGEYVLGTLPAARRREVEALLATDAELARLVDEWSEQLLPLTTLAEPVEPPARLWPRIERTLGLASPARAQAPWWSAGWRSLALWRSLAAGGMLAAAVLASVLLTQPPAGAPRYVVVLVAPQDKAPGWIIQASGRREVDLIPLGSFTVPADKALQFWTKADDWRGPVSLGLVQPGRKLQVRLDQLPPLVPNQLFELTLEPAGGSPIGRPTGPIQFIGRAVPVM